MAASWSHPALSPLEYLDETFVAEVFFHVGKKTLRLPCLLLIITGSPGITSSIHVTFSKILLPFWFLTTPSRKHSRKPQVENDDSKYPKVCATKKTLFSSMKNKDYIHYILKRSRFSFSYVHFSGGDAIFYVQFWMKSAHNRAKLHSSKLFPRSHGSYRRVSTYDLHPELCGHNPERKAVFVSLCYQFSVAKLLV